MPLIGDFELIEPANWLFQSHGDVADCKRRAESYREANGTYEGAEYGNEEFVRQWALARLISHYDYPKE
ncbi:MAG: type I restriction enzyme HsdR N-terminal domain-containing protein [Qipengyuania sp.]|jgi:hypothetical protein|nr:type I restriction enzyme HsdR N-terminal domain-containing protein [Qipengyuania sp.]